jgi:hypothetical protein
MNVFNILHGHRVFEPFTAQIPLVLAKSNRNTCHSLHTSLPLTRAFDLDKNDKLRQVWDKIPLKFRYLREDWKRACCLLFHHETWDLNAVGRVSQQVYPVMKHVVRTLGCHTHVKLVQMVDWESVQFLLRWRQSILGRDEDVTGGDDDGNILQERASMWPLTGVGLLRLRYGGKDFDHFSAFFAHPRNQSRVYLVDQLVTGMKEAVKD